MTKGFLVALLLQVPLTLSLRPLIWKAAATSAIQLARQSADCKIAGQAADVFTSSTHLKKRKAYPRAKTAGLVGLGHGEPT